SLEKKVDQLCDELVVNKATEKLVKDWAEAINSDTFTIKNKTIASCCVYIASKYVDGEISQRDIGRSEFGGSKRAIVKNYPEIIEHLEQLGELDKEEADPLYPSSKVTYPRVDLEHPIIQRFRPVILNRQDIADNTKRGYISDVRIFLKLQNFNSIDEIEQDFEVDDFRECIFQIIDMQVNEHDEIKRDTLSRFHSAVKKYFLSDMLNHPKAEDIPPLSDLIDEYEENDTKTPSKSEINSEREKLEKSLSSKPELTEDTEYEERKEKIRSQAFREMVRDAYDNMCAVCKKRRESPEGNPEIEASHIYPKSEGGKADPRNGIGLCHLHHWAFDVGWFVIDDDYKIHVRNAPNREGYHEFKQLENNRLHLPDDDNMKPHPTFLEAKRELEGFSITD
ncbi:MAG: HNH endonuclease, partial [Candidatus Paceibacteria bacterium]